MLEIKKKSSQKKCVLCTPSLSILGSWQIGMQYASLLLKGLVLAILFGSQLMAADPAQTFKKEEHPSSLIKNVEDALAYSKAHVGILHTDALKVWKNFQKGISDPHYSYRYWARDIILWLQKEHQYAFKSMADVAQVFDVLRDKNLISADAAVVLSADSWSYLVHLEGVPGWDKPGLETKPNLMDLDSLNPEQST